jgi:hypothetical protein
MKQRRNPHVEYRNARRAARLCFDDPEQYSPVYVQVATTRMIQAASAMHQPQLSPGVEQPVGTPVGVPATEEVRG